MRVVTVLGKTDAGIDDLYIAALSIELRLLHHIAEATLRSSRNPTSSGRPRCCRSQV